MEGNAVRPWPLFGLKKQKTGPLHTFWEKEKSQKLLKVKVDSERGEMGAREGAEAESSN